MIQIANDLLDLTYLETKTMKFDFMSVELVDLIELTIQELNRPSVIDEFEIVFQPGHRGLQVMVDSQRIKSVIRNLLINAIVHSNDTDVKKIEVDLTNENNFAKVSVRDYGCGIPNGELDKIFEPFVRASNKRTFK